MDRAEVVELGDLTCEGRYQQGGDKTVDLNARWVSLEELPPYNALTAFVRRVCGKAADKNPARDNMSNERTLLAYVRTSLNVFLLGIIIVQFTKHTILKPVRISLGEDLDKYNSNNEAVVFLKRIVGYMSKYMNPLGAMVMSLGVVVAIVGIFRYFKIQWLLIRGPNAFEEMWLLMASITIVLLATVVTSFVLVYKI